MVINKTGKTSSGWLAIIGFIAIAFLLINFGNRIPGFSALTFKETTLGGVSCYGAGLRGAYDEGAPDGPNKVLGYGLSCSGTINKNPPECNYNLQKDGLAVAWGSPQCITFFKNVITKELDPVKRIVYEDSVVKLIYTGATESRSSWNLEIKPTAFVPELKSSTYYETSSSPQYLIYKINSAHNKPVEAYLIAEIQSKSGIFNTFTDSFGYGFQTIQINPGVNEYQLQLPEGIKAGEYTFASQVFVTSESATYLMNGVPSNFMKTNGSALNIYIETPFTITTGTKPVTFGIQPVINPPSNNPTNTPVQILEPEKKTSSGKIVAYVLIMLIVIYLLFSRRK